MRQHQEPPRLRRPAEQRRYLASAFHAKPQLFDRRHFAAILAESTEPVDHYVRIASVETCLPIPSFLLLFPCRFQ